MPELGGPWEENDEGIWLSPYIFLRRFTDPTCMPAVYREMAAAAIRGIKEHGSPEHYFSSTGAMDALLMVMEWCNLITLVSGPSGTRYELATFGERVYEAVAKRNIPQGWWGFHVQRYREAYDEAIQGAGPPG